MSAAIPGVRTRKDLYLVYLATESGDVYIFQHGKVRKYYCKGRLHAPTAEDDRKLEPGISMDDSITSTPVVANGVLYVLTRSKLYAIRK